MLDHIVREAGRRFGTTPALIAADGVALTYRDLDRRSDRVAGGLAARGVREDDVVAIALPSDDRYLVAMAAVAKVGAAYAGVNIGLSAPERRRVVERSGAAVVLTDDPGAEQLAGPDGSTPNDATLLRSMPEGEPPPPHIAPPERLATVVFTSGTTGEPKGALFRNHQIQAITTIDLGAAATAWGGGGPILASTSFAHVGIATKLAWYLRRGMTLHTLPRWRADDVWDLVESAGLTSIGGVAPQIALLLRSTRCDEVDRSALRQVIAGGAASSPALIAEAIERLGVTYSVRYSSTESGGVGLAADFDHAADACDTIGTPRPGVEATVVDGDGVEVAAGEIGELWVRSPAVFDGYLGDDVATVAALRHGWLRTGDLAVEESGRFRITGRAKEMYVRGGYNVYPGEVEAVLARHPLIAEVAVVATPDAVMGECGVAVVVARDGDDTPTLEELRSFAGIELARWKLPDRLVILDRLPLTAMHKIDRSALREQIVGASNRER